MRINRPVSDIVHKTTIVSKKFAFLNVSFGKESFAQLGNAGNVNCLEFVGINKFGVASRNSNFIAFENYNSLAEILCMVSFELSHMYIIHTSRCNTNSQVLFITFLIEVL